MTSYLLAQAVNILILLGFTLVLVLRTRAEVRRRTRALDKQTPLSGPTPAQRKLELQTKIETLQNELQELDRVSHPTPSA